EMPTFDPDVAGIYVVQLIVNDGTVDSAPDTAAVTVMPPNQAPVVNAGPDQTVYLPDNAILNGFVTDDGLPAGSSLTIVWSKVSGPGPFTSPFRSAAPTFDPVVAASDVVLLLVTGGTVLTAPDAVAVTVMPPNQAPVVNAGPDQTIYL